MARPVFATQFLVNEALSLKSRLDTMRPFALNSPMVAAACISDPALKGITDLMVKNNKELRARIETFINLLLSKAGQELSTEEAQGRFSILKLRFNAMLDQLDIFANVVTQRAEHETGVWMAGLDVLATDALRLRPKVYDAPEVVCFVTRGHGAAIRRARTRLPGGDENPVAVVQVPRERLISSGIASSLIHEVGHQGAALLDLVATLRTDIRHAQAASANKEAWGLYNDWISEIIADFWAMAHLGIGATLGLISVVSLPRYFMFRVRPGDPHPFPWIRVKLSLAFGKALYPHAQWERFEKLWARMYPLDKLDAKSQSTIHALNATMPAFTQLLANHRPPRLNGKRLADIFPSRTRQPAHLQFLFNTWKFAPERMNNAAPSLVFAVMGQAHADMNISALAESKVLSKWLTQWAMLRSESRVTRESKDVLNQLNKFVNY